MEPWTAERAVTKVEARALVESQFPALAPARLEVFGQGWDNVAFLVNGAFVFRFPQRALGARLMAVEIAVMPHAAPRLPLPVPNPIFVGHPAAGYPWPFAGYRRLAGRTACTAALDDTQRSRLAVPLARFLRALHAIPAETVFAWGGGRDTLGKVDVERRLPMIRTALDRLHQLGLLPDVRPHRALVEEIADALADIGPAPLVLVHGDLYVRHLLVDDGGALCGVIDWGDVHAGRAAGDLMIAHTVLPPSAHAAFCAAYGPIAADDWRLAQMRALFHAATLAHYGHRTGDQDLEREGRQALDYLTLA